MNDRTDLTRNAVLALLENDVALVDQVFTENVVVWTPALEVSSRSDLAALLEERDETFPDLHVAIENVDVAGDRGFAEWSATVTHDRPLVVDEDLVLEPTGVEVEIRGLTVAAFDGDRINGIRQYWDEAGLLESLLVAAEAQGVPATR